MSSVEAQAYKDHLLEFGAASATGPADIESARRLADSLISGLGAPVPMTVESVQDGGVKGAWVTPEGVRGRSILMITHGGGYMAGSALTHARVSARLARHLDARAFVVDYRLAPEHTFPAQIEDCFAAYRWLLERAGGPQRIVFAGESAGGALCITTQLMALQHGLAAPAAGFAMSPWLDFECLGGSHVENVDKDVSGSPDTTRAVSGLYLGDTDPRNPLACPLYASLKGLAPLYAQVGGDEIIVDDARRLVERAHLHGVEADLDIVPGMQHMFQLCAGVMPEADAALQRGAAFLRRHLA